MIMCRALSYEENTLDKSLLIKAYGCTDNLKIDFSQLAGKLDTQLFHESKNKK